MFWYYIQLFIFLLKLDAFFMISNDLCFNYIAINYLINALTTQKMRMLRNKL